MTGMQFRGAAAVPDGSSWDDSLRGIAAALLCCLLALMLLLFFSCGIEEGGTVNEEKVAGQSLVAAELPGTGPAASAAASVAQPGMAVLAEGSRIVAGLPGFGRNALPALYGEYAMTGSSGAQIRVPVWFTREALVLPAAWNKAPCRTMTSGFNAVYAEAEADGSILWTLSTTEYHLLVLVPKDVPDPCAFTARFSDRFSFFFRYAAIPEDVSFPAILEL